MINDIWYKNAIFYSLDVETFMDASGDGVGDFHGLGRRLDYLHGLGVTAIWLLPFHPSPGRDDGYDVCDYYGIDPRYGTLGDFVDFTHSARQRGMRVIMDLVVNHTSDQHPWFQSARSDPDSPFRDWYVWSETKPPDADQGMVFPGVQETTWTYDEKAGMYYFHRFYEHQPDLNTENPHVQAEILKIMGFWLQLGISGFRMDAAPFVISRKGADITHMEPRFGMLRELRNFLQWRRGDAIFLAEANVMPEKNAHYFGHDGDRLHMMFNFHLNQLLFHSLATGDRTSLVKGVEETRVKPDRGQWALHLRNHDELDLARLPHKQREEVFEAFGPRPEDQLYGRGIRRRLAPMMNGDSRRIQLAYSLLLTLPGTPVLRYGDEIGMGDDLSLPERYCSRTPMQWSDEAQGGFTLNDNPVLPVISKGPYRYQKVNAAAQRRDPDSFLNWMERMIRMRAEIPEIGWGAYKVIDVGDDAVFGLQYDWRNNTVLFLHNLAGEPRDVVFTILKDDEPQSLVNVLGEDGIHPRDDGSHSVAMEPYGYRWFRVGGLDYLLRRSAL